MKLRYSCLLCCSIKEMEEIYHFVTDYAPDATHVQMNFEDKEIKIFSEDGHLVAQRDFENLF